MAGFLFWNLNRKPLEHLVAVIARERDTDVIVLAECAVPPNEMLAALNEDQNTRERFYRAPSELDRLAVFTRLPPSQWRTLYEDASPQLIISRLFVPSGTDILLAALHLPSKLYWSGASQSGLCRSVADTIREFEERTGHRRTIVVGDFNMDPFEEGIVDATAFHGTMAREVALRRSRRIMKREYPFFYNPMWGHFGDGNGPPPGSYYRPSSEPVCQFWHILDQVLIRPDLLEYFHDRDLELVTTAGETRLVSGRGRPRKDSISDHLPLAFSLRV